MFNKYISALLVPVLLLSSTVQAVVDLTSVGPSTPLSSKTTICNVLNYGGVADNKTDIGPAITKAFSSCASAGGATLYIPPGTYSLQTGVTLNKGSKYAIQIDGLIILTSDGSFGGNAIVVENASDVEVFSSNGLGAINGQGYITRITASGQNARLFRFISCSNISIHDIIFIDSPTFHLIFNSVSNLEAYHITVRGPDIGGTDGIDLICTDNCYLHDIEVTNRDECISVKSPSQNVLIEDMYCNHSGGMSIGSLTADGVTSTTEAAVSNITMRNINVFQCTQMLMIKTFPGGTGATGYVKDSVFENFWAYDTTYGLDIDQYWESHTTPDTGAVALSGLTFSNWTGTVDNGVSRGPIVIRGSDIVPITDITLTGFDMWTVNGKEIINQCKNVYGTGYCAGTATGATLATFTTSVTTTATPAGFTAPASPTWGISGYGTTLPIPVYTPAVFWSPVSSGVAASGSSVKSSSSVVKAVSTSTSVPASTTPASSTKATSTPISASSSKASSSTPTSIPATSTSTSKSTSSTTIASSSIKASSTPLSTTLVAVTSTKTSSSSTPIVIASSSTSTASGNSLSKWSQCGGTGWTGTGTCVSGSTCTVQNEWYSQCL